MEKGIQSAVAVAAAALTLMLQVEGRCADPVERTIVLRVSDLARVSSDDLARARTESQRIFQDADVRVVWLDGAAPMLEGRCRGHLLSVSLLSPYLVQQRTRLGTGTNVLGAASPSEGVAFIFTERATVLARDRSIDQGVLLGRVIAHEVGHLLLGSEHTRSGIMTTGIDTDKIGLSALFSKRESRSIHGLLESKTAARSKAGCEAAPSRLAETREESEKL